MSSTRSDIKWLASNKEGLVTSTTRRWIYFCDSSGKISEGTIATKAMDITVGDIISFKKDDNKFLINSFHNRKNSLKRQIGQKSKLLCANLDLLLIVSAVGKLFQPNFIDRLLCVAALEGIKAILVVNKVDLKIDENTLRMIEVYRNIGVTVLETSTVEQGGLEPVLKLLKTKNLNIISLVGVSGVGKSSILNRLVPDSNRTINTVSMRTGQGKQTTSQAEAFRYQDPSSDTDLFLIDLPGVQKFGISHIEPQELQLGMPDIYAAKDGCEYSDCQHLAEPNCSVKDSLNSGKIAESRYHSYCMLYNEIKAAKEF